MKRPFLPAVAALSAVTAAIAISAPAQADKYFGKSASFTHNTSTNSVGVQAYGNDSTTWYGVQKISISKYYAGISNSSGPDAGRVRVDPSIKISGLAGSISSGGGGFSEVSNTCAHDAYYSAEGVGHVSFYHDGVVCSGSSIDFTDIVIKNSAAARYAGNWYGYTVSLSYYD